MTESERTGSLLTPTRLIAGLALFVAVLGTAVFVKWWMRPPVVTIEIDQPAGETVLAHLVIDGRPESRRGVVPVTYDLEAREVSLAVIPEDASDVSIWVTVSREDGSSARAGCTDGARVTIDARGIAIHGMSAHEAQTMRSAAMTQRETNAR